MILELFTDDDRPLRKITLEETAGSGWLVVSGNRFSPHLGKDEALGVVAAMLYGHGQLPYLGTYRDNLRWQTIVEPAGLLPDHVAPMPTSDFIIYRRELIADAKGIAL